MPDTIAITMTKTEWLQIATALGRDASVNQRRAETEEGVNVDYLLGLAELSADLADQIINGQMTSVTAELAA